MASRLGLSPCKSVQEVVRICKAYVARHLSKGYRLPKWADDLFKGTIMYQLCIPQCKKVMSLFHFCLQQKFVTRRYQG